MTTDNSLRVLRGGGWLNFNPSGVSAASRHWDEPVFRSEYLGFRCARVTTPPKDSLRVYRGGGWYSDVAAGVRAANRHGIALTYRGSVLGFRCARVTHEPTSTDCTLWVRYTHEPAWREVGQGDYLDLIQCVDGACPTDGQARITGETDHPLITFDRLRGELVPRPEVTEDGELVLHWPEWSDLRGEVFRSWHLLPDHTEMSFVYVPPPPLADDTKRGRMIPSVVVSLGEGNREHAVEGHGYWIAEFPVTCHEWRLRGGHIVGRAEARRHWPQASSLPVVSIDPTEATSWCDWAGLSLPTEDEWEYAARGTDGRIYPWGNEEPTDERLHWSGTTRREGPCDVGTHPAGRSPCGAQDMAGNVWEWTASEWKE